jgi:tetratricopeptide (TPR) repeat protein
MKQRVTTIILALGLATPLIAQTQESPKDSEKKPAPIVEINQQFSNLPKKTREEYAQKIIKVQNLFNQKRIFDALEKLDELDKIFPNHPAALNIKGACYVEIRAFKKANAIFSEILRISPDNTNVLFNLAEVDFVTKNWKSAEDRFTKIIPLLPEKNKAMIRLCEFKLLLCKLKLDKKEEAKALVEKYDAWDDSPFYYFSRAAIAYDADDKITAEKLLRNARYVWRNDSALAAWQDTLIEFGYIRSFYGGDTEEKK